MATSSGPVAEPLAGPTQRRVLRAPCLYRGEQPSALELLDAQTGQAGVSTFAGPGKAGPNEDSAAVLPAPEGRLVIVVADGVGGQAAARRASNLAVEVISKTVAAGNSGTDRLRSTILDGIEAANQAVLGLGTGAATTLAVAEVGPGYVRSYHVGDSVILLCGQRGAVKMQTIPHSPVGFAVEAGVLDTHAALHHEELHLISNVLGAADMRIEIGSELPMAPRDTLLVASDGLFDNLLASEIVQIIRAGSLGRALERLTDGARARMLTPGAGQPSKPDDFTAVLFRQAISSAASRFRRRKG